MPFYSHHSFQMEIVNILLDLGHNVTVITEIGFAPHENLTEIRLNESQIVPANTNVVKMSQKILGFWHLYVHVKALETMYENQLNNKKVQDLIQAGSKNHFDLIVIEHFVMHPLFALAELYDCPIIVSSIADLQSNFHSLMGNSINPITDPYTLMLPYIGGEMTFCQRLISTAAVIVLCGFNYPLCPEVSSSDIKTHFPNLTTSVATIKNRIVLTITNTLPALGYIRPSTNHIQVGFLLVKPPKPLVEGNLKRFVDESQLGVIYMNFGSIARVQDMSARTVSVFVEVFRSLQLDVVWKVDNATVANKPENVFITNWVPQADLLAHPKVKLFISHAGIGSITEAIDRAVPMILFPMFADQPFNSMQMQRKGVAIGLELNSITEDILAEAIEEVLKPKYKSNIRHLREVVYDRPMTSHETAVWWIQHVLKHKQCKHLMYPGRNVPFYQKYLIDVILAAGMALFVASKLMKIIRNLIRILRDFVHRKTKQQ